jgi:dihydropyrimidine dehydrogenase (NAD+) subunit PreT
MADGPDIAAGRLAPDDYRANFADLHPPLSQQAAVVEADRCHFCYDAPCVEACPTGIDIPGFIKQIATGNVTGAGLRILEENIFGGACARVCPTEVLCEAACVRTAQEGRPVRIGLLQRHATDPVLAMPEHPFGRATGTGKRVAVVGGGPAGLACAHRLAARGHDVTIFEARDRLGGLNEYGVAEYKVPDRFARAEVRFILGIGGITVRTWTVLGRDVSLADLRRDYDAVFLGIGLTGVRALDCPGEELRGVRNAVDYIASLRQSTDRSKLAIGRRVVVIGGGNTAIDIAVQSRRLGAEDVTIVYRRGPEAMSATGHEQELAQTEGVRILQWARPVRLEGSDGHVTAAVFERTRGEGERLVGTGSHVTLAADMVFKAIGQLFVADPLRADGREMIELEAGRIPVLDDGRTILPGVWAGGDCVSGGLDLTVEAVQHGKVAAESIDRALRQ